MRSAEKPASSPERRAAIRKRQSYISQPWDRVGHRNERRQACRYPATKHSAFLGWWEGDEYRTISGSLVNISLEGALLSVEQTPPTDASVWVCLDGATDGVWVESLVVESTRERHGPLLIRLKFRESCPFAFFNTAIQQATSRDVKTGAASPEFDGRYWK